MLNADAMTSWFSICSASRARCSKGISACRPGCTAIATCRARWCCSIRTTPSAGARARGAAASTCSRRRSCRPRSAASSSARRWAARCGVRAMFAERQDGTLTLRRGFTLAPSDRVLVVEDVITTGGSTRETIAVAEAAGATRARRRGDHRSRRRCRDGSTCRCSRCVQLEVPAYPPEACPLCAKGMPVVKPGSAGRECAGAKMNPKTFGIAIGIRMHAHDQASRAVRRHATRRLAAAGAGISVQGLIEEALRGDRGRAGDACTARGGPTPACTRSARWRARGDVADRATGSWSAR